MTRLPKSSDGNKLPPLLAALAILDEGCYDYRKTIFVDINGPGGLEICVADVTVSWL